MIKEPLADTVRRYCGDDAPGLDSMDRGEFPIIVKINCDKGCCPAWTVNDQPVVEDYAMWLVDELRARGGLVEGNAGDLKMTKVDEAKIVAAQRKRDRKAARRIELSA